MDQKCSDHEMIKLKQKNNCAEICRLWENYEKEDEQNNQARIDGMKDMNEKFDHRPTTGTLLTIAGIFFGVIIALIITLSTVQGNKIEELQKTDARITTAQETTNKELREIKESLIRLEISVKK